MNRLDGRITRLEKDRTGSDSDMQIMRTPEGEESSPRSAAMVAAYAKRGIVLSPQAFKSLAARPFYVPITLDDLSDDELEAHLRELEAIIAAHPEHFQNGTGAIAP